MKFCFVSENVTRETYFVDAPRICYNINPGTLQSMLNRGLFLKIYCRIGSR
jgi:hypothetical protein